MSAVIEQRPEHLPLTAACYALQVHRSAVYHRARPNIANRSISASRKKAKQPRALSRPERQQILDVLHSESFCDQPPAQVFQKLLEQDTYLCSVSTMHRLLRKSG
jgi:putative transposase